VKWAVRLTAAAEGDFRQIVHWTSRQFGDRQALVCAATLSAALEALADGPKTAGVQRRDDIARGLMVLHVARKRRKGRHFVIFRAGRDGMQQYVEVLRVLHDAMDVQAHLR
jgi:toxin ParE1/3/4